ncbi:hypothetical protein BgiBS90_026234, partial [Biomphalaria glabrata]
VNNKSVFDLNQIKELQLQNNIVIISQNKKINKTCQLTGNYSQINLKLLHLEFSTTQSENNTDFFSIKDTEKKVNLYYDYS